MSPCPPPPQSPPLGCGCTITLKSDLIISPMLRCLQLWSTGQQKLVCITILLDDKRKHFICCSLKQRSEFSHLISAILTPCVVWSPPEDSPIYISQTCPQDLLVPLSRLQGEPTRLDQTRHFLGITPTYQVLHSLQWFMAFLQISRSSFPLSLTPM